MIAFSGLRPAIVVSQVVLTFGAAQVAAFAAATRYQAEQVTAAQAAITTADQHFDSSVKQVLEDGTPAMNVDPVVAQRQRLQARALPSANVFIDRLRIDALRKRSADTELLTRQVATTETQVEVELHQQLIDAVKVLRSGLEPAAAAGVDTTPWTAYADTTEKDNSQLAIPRLARQTIAEVKVKEESLRHTTAEKVAANETARQAAVALQNARDTAQAQLGYANAALQRARTIPVLKLADNEKAINDLSQELAKKLASGGTADEFLNLGSSFGAQTYSLNHLLEARQSAYDLLNLTRRELDAAQNAKNDVSAERGQLDALVPLLDQAGDLNTFLTLRAQVQALKNAIDSKYLAALYGVGKVIVTSVTQERLVALQDGVIVQSSMVTSGRPSLPTVLGTYHIYFKASPYTMHSPWPPGNQYWYPDSKMNFAMEFESTGYFIHDAPWRSNYGPGSDTEFGGTHGCINVPYAPMAWLYNWADIGTTVINKQGDLPG
ncbi:MAG: hypothetical protein NVSMB17_16180 [Candidatus Dormibacteria bacterium]